MREIRLYDTPRTRRASRSRATPGRVGIYACGPTVYAASTSATRAVRRCSGCSSASSSTRATTSTLVINITDVNDKIYDAARAAGRAERASWRAR